MKTAAEKLAEIGEFSLEHTQQKGTIDWQVVQKMKEYAQEAIKADRENVAKHAMISYGMNEDETMKLGNPVYDYEYKYDNFDSLPTMEIDKNSIINAPQIELK